MKKFVFDLFALCMSLFLFGCINNSKSEFQQTPPPYLPTYGYILNQEWSMRLILGPYGQLNLEYYISKSDFEGFSSYINTDIFPYINSLSLEVSEANLSKLSTTVSVMNTWLEIIDKNKLEGLITIRNHFF